MKFGIFTAVDNDKAKELEKELKSFLLKRKHQIIGRLKGSDAVLVLGGDGTLIHTACEHVQLAVPFFGINVGTLGFLSAAEADDWKQAVSKIEKGEYFVSERMTLEASIRRLATNDERLTFRAVNEIVVKGMYRVVDLEIVVNGQKFLEISGDGVIVSTQTGSTAYSLSAGGPIVDPELDCLVLTPVNAHGLPIPSIVLSPSDHIEIKVVEGEDISLIIDGQEHTKVTEGQSIGVDKGKYRVKLGYLGRNHFLRALNAKFGLAGRLSK